MPNPARWRSRAALVVATFVTATAHAGVTIDWGKGLVTAEGVGVADRHAPNPAVARGTSRRGAEDAARAQLKAKLGALPLAGGGTVADKAKDAAVAARLDAAVAAALAVSADPETDGAWRVTMGVPIEAVRQAIEGPRTVAPSGDSGAGVVIVDGATAKPAVGWTIGGTHAATLWLGKPPAWAADGPHVKATGATAGAIAVDLAGTNAGAATLFVIIIPQ